MKQETKLNAHRPETKLNLSFCAAFISHLFRNAGLSKNWDSQRARIIGVSLLIHLIFLIPLGLITISHAPEKFSFQEYQEVVIQESSIDELIENPDPPTSEQEINSGGSTSPFNADELMPATQIPDLIGGQFSSDFQIPFSKTPLTGSGLGKAGLGVGTDLGSGVGSGRGTDTQTLGGISITKGVMIVVLDVSGSMTEYNLNLRKQIKEKFSDAIVIESNSATGNGFGITEESDLSPANDLYDAAYRGMKGRLFVASIYMLSDFEDGSDPSATEKFIQVLREREIKLYLCYIKKKPYAKLLEYAQQHGDSEKFELVNMP